MHLRNYQSADLPEMARMFYETVHSVCAREYTSEQLDAWATGVIDTAAWDASLRAHHSIVAVEGEIIVGFGDMDETGYLDRLYVHKDFLRQGIATAICNALEQAAPVRRFTTHASMTARPFFEQRGYRVLKIQTVERFGVPLTNFIMHKP